MRYMSIATFTAALMMSASSVAYAQGGQQGHSQQFGQGSQGAGGEQQQWGQQQRGDTGQQFGQDQQSRFYGRSALRQQLRQIGFRNIRILDAAYLVQAQTPDDQSS